MANQTKVSEVPGGVSAGDVPAGTVLYELLKLVARSVATRLREQQRGGKYDLGNARSSASARKQK